MIHGIDGPKRARKIERFFPRGAPDSPLPPRACPPSRGIGHGIRLEKTRRDSAPGPKARAEHSRQSCHRPAARSAPVKSPSEDNDGTRKSDLCIRNSPIEGGTGKPLLMPPASREMSGRFPRLSPAMSVPRSKAPAQETIDFPAPQTCGLVHRRSWPTTAKRRHQAFDTPAAARREFPVGTKMLPSGKILPKRPNRSPPWHSGPRVAKAPENIPSEAIPGRWPVESAEMKGRQA